MSSTIFRPKNVLTNGVQYTPTCTMGRLLGDTEGALCDTLHSNGQLDFKTTNGFQEKRSCWLRPFVFGSTVQRLSLSS